MSNSTARTLPILVGIDGSAEAEAAARWAATYADKVHATVRLVHAVPVGDWYGSAQFVDGGALERDLRAMGRKQLVRAEGAIHDVAPTVTVETVDVDGSIASYVADVGADMVVLGSRKSNVIRDLTLGSNTLRVVTHAHCPVLLLRSETERAEAGRPIVVGIDGSEQSDRALGTALEMADNMGVPVVAVNYWGFAAQAGIGTGAGYIDWEAVREHEKRWLEMHVEKMHEKYPEVKLTTVSAQSSPTRGLRALSASASMIVVGCRGRGALRGAVLGSVSQNLVHHADCSVLVVR
ncbi:universal stress protein [Rhodococcoides fascians A25f]|uniref:universal stress protein n=1 Tax=Rhodococcoides fascians TaxID=1828 RepID=UPI000567DEA8|nr:universal stress protein [Rhodococcus fascians]QII08361.1 universal stress protein [Rhodococcus fascians A25f]